MVAIMYVKCDLGKCLSFRCYDFGVHLLVSLFLELANADYLPTEATDKFTLLDWKSGTPCPSTPAPNKTAASPKANAGVHEVEHRLEHSRRSCM
jgi:hypothetical protein